MLLTLQVLSYAGRVALENPATELAQLLDDAGDARSVRRPTSSLLSLLRLRSSLTQITDASQLARTDTRFSAATTLVDPFADPGGAHGYGDSYGKPENEHDLGLGAEDGERQPLASMATGGALGRGDEEALASGGGGPQKFGRWTMLQMHWRDYLVRRLVLSRRRLRELTPCARPSQLRPGLLFASVGLVVGVVVCASPSAPLHASLKQQLMHDSLADQSIAQRRQNEEALSSLSSDPSLPAATSS